ncbi:MAG: hypothetical protein OXC42_08215 [Gammaproteobacteria bacterium]|nr:hypothetical protein [Gammaproteobacteria bacterium]
MRITGMILAAILTLANPVIAHEQENLEQTAQLVVLSMCNSALSQVRLLWHLRNVHPMQPEGQNATAERAVQIANSCKEVAPIVESPIVRIEMDDLLKQIDSLVDDFD